MEMKEAIDVIERALGRRSEKNPPETKEIDRALRHLKGEPEPMRNFEAKALIVEELAKVIDTNRTGRVSEWALNLERAAMIMMDDWQC
jgi:hypothetical protein